jgi:hypothetical protein
MHSRKEKQEIWEWENDSRVYEEREKWIWKIERERRWSRSGGVSWIGRELSGEEA